MSRDSLPRYELLTQVSEGPVRTYHALASTGAVVMVHFVDARDPAGHAPAEHAVRLIDRLDPTERRKVLEVAELEDSVAVVSKFILDFDSFFGWLERGAGPAVDAGPPAGGAASPGEFTRLFRTAGDSSDPAAADVPEPAASTPTVPPAIEHQPATTDDAGPGEFTRAFRIASGAGPPDESHSGSPPPPPPAAEPGGGGPGPEPRPGETPRSGTGAPPSSARTPPAEREPGEFTRAFEFGVPLGGGDREPVDPSREPAAGERSHGAEPGGSAAEAPMDTGPGEFTRAFRALDPPAPERKPPARPTGEVADGSDATAGEPPAPLSGPPPESPAGAADGPGEFTRTFGAVDVGRTPTDVFAAPGPVPDGPADPASRDTPSGPAGEASGPAEPRTEPSSPGEFTRAFRAAELEGANAPPAAGEPSGAATDPSAPAAGEFTRMFHVGDPGLDAPADDPPPAETETRSDGDSPADAPRAPTVDRSAEPGEFTRLFRSPAGAGADDPVDAAPPPPAPRGTPTGLPEPDLGSRGPGGGPAQPGAPRLRWRGEQPPSGAGGEPGEFTKIFGRPDVPGAGGPPPGSPPGGIDYRQPADSPGTPASGGNTDDYFGRLVGGAPPPSPANQPPAPTTEPPQPSPPGAPAVPPWLGGTPAAEDRTRPPAGPSEYTRIISAQQPPPPAPAQPPAAPAQPPAAPAIPPAEQTSPRSTPTILLVGILVVLIAMLGVIVYFAIRSPETPPAAPDAPVEAAPEESTTS